MNTQVMTDEPRGHTPLWVAFWLYGVLASHVLFGAILYLYRQVSTAALAAMLLGFLLYTAWIMRTVWLNAFNVRNETYGHIARYLTVAWSLNAILISGFLLLGHIGKLNVPF